MTILFVFFISLTAVNAKELTIDELAKEVKDIEPDTTYVYVIGKYAFTSSHTLTTQDTMLAARTIKVSAQSEATDKGAIYGEMTIAQLNAKLDNETLDFIGLEYETNIIGTTKASEKYNIKYIDYAELKEDNKLEIPVINSEFLDFSGTDLCRFIIETSLIYDGIEVYYSYEETGEYNDLVTITKDEIIEENKFTINKKCNQNK